MKLRLFGVYFSSCPALVVCLGVEGATAAVQVWVCPGAAWAAAQPAPTLGREAPILPHSPPARLLPLSILKGKRFR